LLSALALCCCAVAKSSLVVRDIQFGVGAMLNGARFGSSTLHWYSSSDFSPDGCACNRRFQPCPPCRCTLAGRTFFNFASLSCFDLGLTLLVCLYLPTSCAMSSLPWECWSWANDRRPCLGITPDCAYCRSWRRPKATLLEVQWWSLTGRTGDFVHWCQVYLESRQAGTFDAPGVLKFR
jgi:hypothetical protein